MPATLLYQPSIADLSTMSGNINKKTGTDAMKSEEKKENKKTVPSLGALDEDDEFEEFETDGMC